MQITKLFCACWKGKSKTRRDLCNSAVFFTPLCCFAGIEMQKEGKQEEGKVPGEALGRWPASYSHVHDHFP
jgi:hypothetical protein